MSKGLEALDLIFDDLRQFEEVFLNGLTKEDKQRYETVKKELNALEIIVKKNVVTSWIKSGISLEDYNDKCAFGCELTQEEFDLLKEV